AAAASAMPSPAGSPARSAVNAPLPLDEGVFLAALYDSRRKALRRAGLCRADRDDLVQRAAMAILRRSHTYRAEDGTPGQWLGGILRNELRAFQRELAKQPLLAPDKVAAALAEAPDPEERTATVDLAYHLLGTLPVEQHRVVVLH